MMEALTVLGTLVLIVLIFLGAYWFTKFLGKRYQGGMLKSSAHIQVLEQISLGQDRTLTVVKVGDSTLLLGVTSQQITLVKELTSEEFPDLEISSQTEATAPFTSLFKDALKTWGMKPGGKDGKKH